MPNVNTYKAHPKQQSAAEMFLSRRQVGKYGRHKDAFIATEINGRPVHPPVVVLDENPLGKTILK